MNLQYKSGINTSENLYRRKSHRSQPACLSHKPLLPFRVAFMIPQPAQKTIPPAILPGVLLGLMARAFFKLEADKLNENEKF
ncbi:MAG: hypothetical protein HKL95_00810 [Phycisphaerae bacterium]|nr:hypothetical protein [Phycisphaerae bacterium]